MHALFSNLLSLATIVFALSSMLAVGIRYTLPQIINPLRDWRLVIGALLANFVLVPALAFGITRLLSIGHDREIGLILVATAAGAPFLIKLAQLAGSDIAIASSLLVLLIVATILYMPLVVPRIESGANVSAGRIAQPLVLTLLLPLIIGLIADRVVPDWTNPLLPLLGIVSNVALVVLLIATLFTNLGRIIGVVGTGAILAALLFIAGSFAIGYLIGTPSHVARDELGLATAQRNIAAATVVATQAIDNPDTTVMVVVTSVVAIAILFPVAAVLRRSAGGEEANARLNKRTGAPG